MKTMTKLISLMLMWVMCACSSRQGATDSCGTTIFEPRYATGFSICSLPDSSGTILRISTPWQGAKNEDRDITITNPAQRIVAMSSTHVAMLDALGCSNRIVGVSGFDFICTPTVIARRDSIADVGYDSNVNYETLVGTRPDMVLLYGVYGPHPLENKLKELGIPYIYIGDYMEESPLGKAEWIVALGEITGHRREAIDLFEQIPDAYNREKARLNNVDTPAPKVMLNTPYGDAWYMPPAGSYMVTLIEDAGGEYMYSQNKTGKSVAVDLEEIYLMAQKADVWLNPGTVTTIDELKQSCPRFTAVPPVLNNRVYNNNRQLGASGGNAFYETSIICPHIVLRDIIKVFHPDLVEEDFVYYRQLQ